MSRNAEELAKVTADVIKAWFKPYEARIVGLEREVAGLRALLENRAVKVHEAGARYQAGDQVVHRASTWLCRKATQTVPGNDPESWLLSAKCGRDGRDLR